MPHIRELQASGITSRAGISAALNVRKVATASGAHLDLILSRA